MPFVCGCFSGKDQASVVFFSRACCLQHFKDHAARPLPFEQEKFPGSVLLSDGRLCLGRDRGSGVWETGSISSSGWGGRLFTSQWHTPIWQHWNIRGMCHCHYFFFFLIWKQSTKHHNHMRKMESIRSFHMMLFDFFLICNKLWWQYLDAYLLMKIWRLMWKNKHFILLKYLFLSHCFSSLD